MEIGVGHGLDVVAQGVDVNASLAVGVHPDHRFVLAGAPRLVRVGISRGQNDVAGHHHRVLVELVDRVLELGGQPIGDRVLGRRFLHGVLVLGPVEALISPAAGDRFFEFRPVWAGEGTGGEMEHDQPLAVADRLEKGLLVGVRPLRFGRAARRVLVIEQENVVLREVGVGQVPGRGRRDIDRDLSTRREDLFQRLCGRLPVMTVIARDDQQLDRQCLSWLGPGCGSGLRCRRKSGKRCGVRA